MSNARRILWPLALGAGATTIATIALVGDSAASTSNEAQPAKVAATPALVATVRLSEGSGVSSTLDQARPTTNAQEARGAQVQRDRNIRGIQAIATMVAVHDAFTAATAHQSAQRGAASASPAPASSSSSGGFPNPYGLDPFFACVAWRESNDIPSVVNSSSGAGGLFQFLPSTWANLGLPGRAEQASVADQIAAAQRLYAMEGGSPWAGGNYSC